MVYQLKYEYIFETPCMVYQLKYEYIRDAMHGVSTGFGPQSNKLASIMRGFKSAVTIRVRILKIPFEWQPRYHDRVIRDNNEYRRIAGYIEQNPTNWKK